MQKAWWNFEIKWNPDKLIHLKTWLKTKNVDSSIKYVWINSAW